MDVVSGLQRARYLIAATCVATQRVSRQGTSRPNHGTWAGVGGAQGMLPLTWLPPCSSASTSSGVNLPIEMDLTRWPAAMLQQDNRSTCQAGLGNGAGMPCGTRVTYCRPLQLVQMKVPY